MNRGISLNFSARWAARYSIAACSLPVVAAMSLLSGPAEAETSAGTPIVNTAALRYDVPGATQAISSNTVTLIVAERLDVALVRDGQGAIVMTSRPMIVPLTLTNRDNGMESFAVAASVAPGAIILKALVVDTDGDGLYDPVKDSAPSDRLTPVLAPGQSVKLFAVLVAPVDPAPGGGLAGALTVTARSTTGSGTPATTYAGRGDGGGDAVVGPTGAIASVVVPLTTASAGPTLLKSQSVRAPDGSPTAVRDSVITYTLEARFTDAVTGARIADPIPAGTIFVPGSLTLDGVSISDGADDDAGRFDTGTQGPGITVALGQVAAASVHTVQFKAKIQ